MKEVKRELVSSSSDWKLLCWPSGEGQPGDDACQGQIGVGEFDHVAGEVDFEHIAEAARHRSLDAEPGAAQIVDRAEAGSGTPSGR